MVLLAAELHSLQATARPFKEKKQGDIANEDQDEDQSWRRCLGHLAKTEPWAGAPIRLALGTEDGNKKSD